MGTDILGADTVEPVTTGAIDDARRRVAELDALPLPGSGATRDRWRAFADIARHDLSTVRIAEGHADARAILVELDAAELLERGALLGVWAAEPQRLTAIPVDGGWVLDGVKGWCSGSDSLDAALVTATAPDGPRLFLVDTSDVTPEAGSWQPMGMAATRSETVRIHDLHVPATHAVGGADTYVHRPGFGHGGCGVAACWWGGALGVLDGVRSAVEVGGADPAALGRAHADLAAAGTMLADAAARIDARPLDEELALRCAAEVRLAVAASCRRVLDGAITALGASGLCHRPDHSARVADLLVYLAQHREASAAADHGHLVARRTLDPTW